MVARFALTALIWLVPAVLFLPLVLVVIALSVLGSDGTILELVAKLRGGVLTALGPLLVVVGGGLVAFTANLGADLEEWLTVALFAALTMGGGFIAIRHSLRRIAAEMRAG